MKKDKVTVSLPPELLKLEEQQRTSLGFSTRSELIEQALREYLAGKSLSPFTGEIVRLYDKLERRGLKEMEHRLSALSYKMAVEMAQINLTLAYLSDFTEHDVHKLRERAVRLVNQSQGFVSLPLARKNKVELDKTDEEDEM